MSALLPRSSRSSQCSRPPRPPRRLLHMLRHDERGVLDIELVGFIPALVIVLLLLLQGFLAVSTVTSTSAAARDGARAAMLGRFATAAAENSLPDWVTLQSVTDDCGNDHCVQVTARVPIGLPAFTTEHITVTRTAYFPED